MTSPHNYYSDKQLQHMGREFGKGFASGLVSFLIVCWIIALVLTPIVNTFTPTDSTDAGRYNRSGFKLMVDHETGVEYLATRNGGLIERIK